ncbi:MAG: DUF1501 domain-containing protein [Lacipirellulaceae bacterium]
MPRDTNDEAVARLRVEALAAQTRRQFFGAAGLGLGALALSTLGGRSAVASTPATPAPLGVGAHSARAKNVIYIHLAGAPSQLELFDYKPELKRNSGKTCPDEFLAGKRFAFIRGVPKMLGPVFDFAKHGETGQWVSELLPHMAGVIDEFAMIRSMTTDQFNHAPAQLLAQTGQPRLGYPSIGSWVTYGIGSETSDLPAFVVLLSGGKTPDGGKSLWGSGFLPTVYQGVQCRDTGDPVLYLARPRGVSRSLRRRQLDAIGELNEMQFAEVGDPETRTRIAQYELAYRMQDSAPKVMNLADEPQHVLDLYGARPGAASRSERETDPRTFYRGDDATFANNCLLARRLVESGVRFVQIYDWGWDHHGTQPGESIDETLPIKAQQVDRATAGLIKDLKQRGMLDDTLVVWGGEFGRTPMAQNNVRDTPIKGFFGRDHHPHAFTMLMAGGGVKPGVTLGETDELGYYPVGAKHTLRDLHATLLHQLGIDPMAFGYDYQGLRQRLIGPTNEGRVLHELLA